MKVTYFFGSPVGSHLRSESLRPALGNLVAVSDVVAMAAAFAAAAVGSDDDSLREFLEASCCKRETQHFGAHSLDF